MNTIKLPVTGFITLESDEDQWNLLKNGLVNQLKCTAIVKVENRKVRIKLTIISLIGPGQSRFNGHVGFKGNLGEQVSMATENISNFLFDNLLNNQWTFFGFIEGQTRIPIMISYYQLIKMAVYTQKTKDQTVENFFPRGFDPQLN